MTHSILERRWILPLLGCAGVVVAVLWYGAVTSPRVAAQDPGLCRVAMVIDRSGSVGTRNLNTIREQILYLFQLGGLQDPNIYLAFWSFSDASSWTNYNAPFHTFVSSQDGDIGTDFNTRLRAMVSSGATNYEQGFGYNYKRMNTADGIDDIITKANIIVFMTDGLPNVPGVGDNNPDARNAGRTAVLKHKEAGKLIVGGIVGNASQSGLNYVLNGSERNATNTFRISTNYSNLSDKLKEVIGTKCNELQPPPPPAEYNLIPDTFTNDRIVSGSGNATFNYKVTNTAASASFETEWSVKRIIVNKDQEVKDIEFSNPEYRDGMSCPQLEGLVNDRGRCSDVVSGRRTFPPGETSMNLDAASATTVAIEDEWSVGTKVCFVLTIAQPTQSANPKNRYSAADCLTIGKHPKVQVHGGDVLVGRRFVGDSAGNDEETVKNAIIRTSLTQKNDGKTYGSWAEYGVFAPGKIIGFASGSGLAGGFDSIIPDSQAAWSRLTFANAENTFGEFKDINGSQATIPDATGAILDGNDVARDLSADDTVDVGGPGAVEGRYEKPSGDLKIKEGLIAKGKTIVVHVPDGTAVIDGNLSYVDGPYTSISEIPRLIIIAKNIAISPDVTNVDAWLISSHKEGGMITTCNTTDTLTSSVCSAPLRINGAIMARKLDLKRTGGAGPGGAAGDPAEVINLRADSYLWSQNDSRSGVRARTTSTTELPPYF